MAVVISLVFHCCRSNIFIPYAHPQEWGLKFLLIWGFEKLRYLSKRWKLRPQVSTAPLTFPCRFTDHRAVRSFCTTMSSSRKRILSQPWVGFREKKSEMIQHRQVFWIAVLQIGGFGGWMIWYSFIAADWSCLNTGQYVWDRQWLHFQVD